MIVLTERMRGARPSRRDAARSAVPRVQLIPQRIRVENASHHRSAVRLEHVMPVRSCRASVPCSVSVRAMDGLPHRKARLHVLTYAFP